MLDDVSFARLDGYRGIEVFLRTRWVGHGYAWCRIPFPRGVSRCIPSFLNKPRIGFVSPVAADQPSRLNHVPFLWPLGPHWDRTGTALFRGGLMSKGTLGGSNSYGFVYVFCFSDLCFETYSLYSFCCSLGGTVPSTGDGFCVSNPIAKHVSSKLINETLWNYCVTCTKTRGNACFTLFSYILNVCDMTRDILNSPDRRILSFAVLLLAAAVARS